MKTTQFEIEGAGNWNGWTDGKRWNGWEMPWFEREVALDLVDTFSEQFRMVGMNIQECDIAGEWFDVPTLNIGTGGNSLIVYRMGDGMTWDSVSTGWDKVEGGNV